MLKHISKLMDPVRKLLGDTGQKASTVIRESGSNKLVKSIDSQELKEMLIQASYQLDEHQSYLNQINVYPVPDGDTGSNLVHTMQAVRKELERTRHRTLAGLAELVAQTATLNARGNIGIITSQYFVGFMGSVAELKRISAAELVRALRAGERKAFLALDKPKRGTVLDVFTAAADAAEAVAKRSDNIVDILDASFQSAQSALEETRHILPQMKKAQVVDAGGAGFLFILGGFVSSIIDNQVVMAEDTGRGGIAMVEEEDLSYRYCTECVLREAKVAVDELKRALRDMGNSMHVVSSGDIIKLHMHTNQPESVQSLCRRYGSIEDWKVDDMQQMQQDNLKRFSQLSKRRIGDRVAIVADTGADFPEHWEQKYPIFKATLPIFLDEDQQDISHDFSPEQFYQKMKNDSSFTPKTSQPNPADFVEQYTRALQVADRVVCLPLSIKLSGTHRSATSARDVLEQHPIHIIDTQTTSAGIALMTQFVFERLERGQDLVDVVSDLYGFRERINIYFLVSDLRYLQRGGRLSKGKSLMGSLLRMSPLLAVRDGRVVATDEKILFTSREKRIELLTNKIREYLQEHSLQHVYVVHAGARQEAEALVTNIQDKLGIGNDLIEILYLSKVLGSHLGPGAIGTIFA